MGFPCNQFGSQEPGTNEEIIAFVAGYKVAFQLMDKVNVNGKGTLPLFSFLKGSCQSTFGSFIKWNFTKFLVDRNGKPFKRYGPQEAPFSFEDDIKALLSKMAS